MFVIDTDIASELMRPVPAIEVTKWISTLDGEELYLTAVSETELLYGIAILPGGNRKNSLAAAMNRWLNQGFRDRILPFDSAAAGAFAEIAASRR